MQYCFPGNILCSLLPYIFFPPFFHIGVGFIRCQHFNPFFLWNHFLFFAEKRECLVNMPSIDSFLLQQTKCCIIYLHRRNQFQIFEDCKKLFCQICFNRKMLIRCTFLLKKTDCSSCFSGFAASYTNGLIRMVSGTFISSHSPVM